MTPRPSQAEAADHVGHASDACVTVQAHGPPIVARCEGLQWRKIALVQSVPRISAAGNLAANASIGICGMLDIQWFMRSKCMGFGQFSLCDLNFTVLDPAFFDEDRFKSVKPREKIVVPAVQ